MEKIYDYTIKLIRYVLKGDVPSLPENIDFEKLYDFAVRHGIEVIVYTALKNLKVDLPENIETLFDKKCRLSIMIDTTQIYEFKKLSNEFNNAGIDYLPLKGIVTRNLYKNTSYRKSGDVDFLVRECDMENAEGVLLQNGYKCDASREYELHSSYQKQPFMMVEIHDRLVENNNRAYDAFKNIWDKVRLETNSEHCYKMDIEYYYAFIIAHLCKHIKNNGAGIKFIIDIWILNDKYRDNFDYDKLKWILRKSNIAEFEKVARKLSKKWFECIPTDDKNVDILGDFIIKSGSFGNKYLGKLIKASAATVDRKSKFIYFACRVKNNIFVPYRELRKQYQYIKKYKILYPFACVNRIWDLITKQKRTIKSMFDATFEFDSCKSRKLLDLYNMVSDNIDSKDKQ